MPKSHLKNRDFFHISLKNIRLYVWGTLGEGGSTGRGGISTKTRTRSWNIVLKAKPHVFIRKGLTYTINLNSGTNVTDPLCGAEHDNVSFDVIRQIFHFRLVNLGRSSKILKEINMIHELLLKRWSRMPWNRTLFDRKSPEKKSKSLKNIISIIYYGFTIKIERW